MTSTNELFAQLNTARVAAGKAPLKAWKESRAKLEAAIAAFEAPAEELARQEGRPSTDLAGAPIIPEATAEDEAAYAEQQQSEVVADTAAAPEPIAKPKRAKAAPAAAISAAAIIAEFGINAKVGRALLRKHNVKKDAASIRAFFKARAKK